MQAYPRTSRPRCKALLRGGVLLNHLMRTLRGLGLLALCGPLMASSVARAALPTHQDLVDQIDNLLPAWSQTLLAAERFVMVMGGAAVLDKETGLVWEKAPDAEASWDRKTWYAARAFCNDRVVGNRKGWRLPTVQELASLVDPSQQPPSLPAGHPFTVVVQPAPYAFWSATTQIEEPNRAWFVDFGNYGSVFTFDKVFSNPAYYRYSGLLLEI
jgi:hypothetical protein